MLGQQKSEADLMLALNEPLQKAGEEMRFCRVRYSPSGEVSALLTKKPMPGQSFLGYQTYLFERPRR